MVRFLPERLRPLYSCAGRSGRKAFWIAQIAILGTCPIVALPLVLVALGLQRLGLSDPAIILMLAPLVVLAVVLVFFAGFCAVVRRLHDRGKSANWIWLFFGPGIFSSVTGLGLGTSVIDLVVLAAQAATAIWYVVELGILPGVAAAGSEAPLAAEIPPAADATVVAVTAPVAPVPAPVKAARPKSAARVVRAGPPVQSAASAGGFGRRQLA